MKENLQPRPSDSRAADAPEHADPIDAAVEVFLRRGYDGTSIEDLVQATGLNRYAIYRRYGGKKELYLAVLEHYHKINMAELQEALAKPGSSPFETLEAVFKHSVEIRAAESEGCIFCDASVEVAPNESDVAARLQTYAGEMKQGFAMVAARAQALGEARADLSPAQIAELLYGMVLTIGLRGRMGEDPNKIKEFIELVLASLRPDQRPR